MVILDKEDLNLLSWEFEDTSGSANSNLFPVELGSGSISLRSNLDLWSPYSTERVYKVKPKKSIAYIFKRIGDVNYLKATTIITKIRYNTRGKREPNKIILDIKTKLAKWYDKPITLNKQLKCNTPKDFFGTVFKLDSDDMYYADGIDESSFLKITDLNTKDYETMSELLKAYCSNGVRFIFDTKERIKIFSDFKTENIKPCKEVNYNITDLMLSDNEQMIYNTINTKTYQRQPLFNFEELDSKYVKYFRKMYNAVDSNRLISVEDNGDYRANVITIHSPELHSSVQLKDYVSFKRTKEPYIELPAQVIAIDKDFNVTVLPILKDKDYKLFYYGKDTYLYDLLVTNKCKLDLYYVRKSLPIIFKYTRKINGEERDNNLHLPLLPKVNGETKYTNKTNISFGCASNLKAGKYSGVVEEVDKIYGTWDNTKLLYDREIEQFANKDLPPIFALSNHMEERILGVGKDSMVKNYTSFDNSNLLLEIERPKSKDNDAILKMSNTYNVDEKQDLMVDHEINRMGDKVIQVSNLSRYNIGDVLIVNPSDDLNEQEELEFDEVLSKIRWRVIAKTTQEEDGEEKHYVYLDTPFAKRQQNGKVYEFTKFPNWSIVYLQELFFRGNPVIEFEQDVVGYSKSVDKEGETSVSLYGEKEYQFDSKQLDKQELRKMMGYILHNFGATDLDTTKYFLPISLVNALDLEVLDVISVIDPKIIGINKEMKWLVLSMKISSNTNEVHLKLLNLNKNNTEPYKIEIDDVLEYQPIDIPDYNHAGGEGKEEENNDGQGGTSVDKSLGQFWLAEIDTKEFRAKVDKFEENYIYFKDFAGTELRAFQEKLFPVSEFAVNINGEVIFVQSDQNYRAFIKKRGVYDTTEVDIVSDDIVSFMSTTTYVDVDGTLYGRNMMMGDGDSYLSVDTINGVKVVGKFVIGEKDKNKDNDLWNAYNNNRTFQQVERPVNTPEYILKKGDIWYDTDDENHAYRFDGKVWVSARDGSIVSTQNNVFVQDTKPLDKEGKPLIEGDTWYDTSDGNKPYVYQKGQWVNVTDLNLTNAINSVQEQANESTHLLDDIANDNKLTPNEKQQVLKEIEEIKIEYPKYIRESEKLGLDSNSYTNSYTSLIRYISEIVTDTETTSDIDRDTFNEYFKQYFENRQVLLENLNDKIKESAIFESNNYASKLVESLGSDFTKQIDGKIETYNQTTDPSRNFEKPLDHKGDLWYNTYSRELKRWDGRSWILMDSKDSVAEAIAKSKKQIFTSTPQPPYSIGDLWLTKQKELYVCISESDDYFSQNDWSIATRYTDDSFAKEVETKTDQALKLLSDIASDSKLNPNEKQVTKKEWDKIKIEFPMYVSQADSFGVSVKSLYESYSQLESYIEPLLKELDTTSNINGDVFREKFNNYYMNRQSILSNINKSIKDSAINESKDYSNTIMNNLNDYLVEQIDEKIDTYNQSTDPSYSWENKSKHKGDLWYSEDTRLLKRWDGLYWVVLDSRDSLAESLARSKKQIFTNRPTPPYDIGDLWITNSKDLYVCNISKKENGVFSSADWGLATKYTDDTLASYVNKQTQKALQKLEDIANDNKLTPSEKQVTKKEWEDIELNHQKFITQANLFEVNSRDFSDSYYELKAYVQPLIDNLNTTTPMDGETFRNKFNSYYTERQTLLDNINLGIKDSAIEESKLYSDGIIKTLGESLKIQIDGKIETYNQQDDPSKRFIEPLDHVGDLWYNTNNRELCRWTGQYWSTLVGKDPIAEALAKSKKQVFTETPIPPYSVGDLWITSSKDLYVCNHENDVKYVSSDWSIATKYTDDTLAKEVEKQAEKALSELSDIASDSKLTPSEKQFTKKEWDKVYVEHPIVLSQASLFGLPTEKLKSTYETLENYLKPLLKELDTTSMINGSVFRETFSLYYKEKQMILNSISNTIKDKAIEESNSYTDKTKEDLDNKIQGVIDSTNAQFRDSDGKMTEMQSKYEKTVEDFTNFETETSDRIDTVQGALDSGDLVINSNTVFDGSARFLSQGSGEVVTIDNGEIAFHRNGQKLSRIKNFRYGSINTDSKGKGIVDFKGFRQPMIVTTSIKSANFGKNMASLFCYAENISGTKYRFYVGGTNEDYREADPIKVNGTKWYMSNVVKTTLMNIGGYINGYRYDTKSEDYLKERSVGIASPPRYRDYLTRKSTFHSIPKYRILIYRKEGDTRYMLVDKVYTLTYNISKIKRPWSNLFSIKKDKSSFEQVLNIVRKLPSRSNVTYEIVINILNDKLDYEYYWTDKYFKVNEGGYFCSASIRKREKLSIHDFKDLYITASAETSTLSGATGYGAVSYLAMEVD